MQQVNVLEKCETVHWLFATAVSFQAAISHRVSLERSEELVAVPRGEDRGVSMELFPRRRRYATAMVTLNALTFPYDDGPLCLPAKSVVHAHQRKREHKFNVLVNFSTSVYLELLTYSSAPHPMNPSGVLHSTKTRSTGCLYRVPKNNDRNSDEIEMLPPPCLALPCLT